MTDYTGPCTITTTVVIDSKIVRCELNVNGGALTVKNSYLLSTGVNVNSGSMMMTDSYINGGVCRDCNIYGANWTVLRTEIEGGNRGAWCTSSCTLQDSYLHNTQLDPNGDAHGSAMRVQQYSNVIHNTLSCDWQYPNDATSLGCSADMSGYPDFAPIHHNTIDGNLFVANPAAFSYCAYGGGTQGKDFSGDPQNATYIVFRNNVFQRGSNGNCGTYGPITDFIVGRTGNVWQNNRWDDGSTVNPG